MTAGQAAQNVIFFGLPVAIYAIVRWRSGLAFSEIRSRLGLELGDSRSYLAALAITIPTTLLTIWISQWTSGFKGSTIGPFVGAPPTQAIIASSFTYGFLATGFPEELLFRGLIAGALFRRSAFWKANLMQSLVFTIPHLLILFVVPRLWPLVVCLPMGLGLASGWLRRTSGSIWPGVILHAVPNIAGALWVVNWSQ